MMNYTTGKGTDARWIVAETAFNPMYQGKCEAIFAQGNGYLGQRAATEEDYPGRTPNLFVTGTFDAFDGCEVTELPNLPDMTAVAILVDGQRFSLEQGTTVAYERTLNLRTGVVERRIEWISPVGKRLDFHFVRFVSMKHEHTLGLRMEVTARDCDAVISVTTGIDGTVTNTGTQHFHEGAKRLLDQRIMRMTAATLQTDVTVCQHVSCQFFVDGAKQATEVLPIISRRQIACKAVFSLTAGQTLRMDKLCTVNTSRDRRWETEVYSTEALEAEGLELIKEAEQLGFDALLSESARTWEALWRKIDIRISGNDFDQLAIRFAQYHMNIFIKKDDNRVGIGAKGLSGEGYKGHSFWDTEIFLLPYFLLTQPSAARTLLEYRYNTLEGARKKARDNHCEGAMYPWESAWKDDGEVTPLWGGADIVTGEAIKIWTGLIELHITADIAFAVQQYFRATGDQDFMDRYGYEIVIETARFWSSRAEWNAEKERFEYTDVIGPDEYKDHVDNNAYTNYMAAHNMRLGLQAMAELQARRDAVYERLNGIVDFTEAAKQIQKVLDKLYLPLEDENGILAQFDGYADLQLIDLTKYKKADVVGTIYQDYSHEQINSFQVGKQADVLVLFLLLEELFSAETKKKNFYYYETRTLHDSSLSRSTHAVLAADLGLVDMAYSLFEGAEKTDMGPVMKSSDAGIHAASMGGIWQSVVYGFGGVRIVGDNLRIEPKLPQAWSELSFPLVWRGQELFCTVTRNEICIENRGDADVTPVVCGKVTTIACGNIIRMML